MPRAFTLFFFFLMIISLVGNVRAALPLPVVEDPHLKPVYPEPPHYKPYAGGKEPGGKEPGGNGNPAPGEGQEAEIEKEDKDYKEILDAVSSIIDDILSAADDESLTATSASIPPGASPCFDVGDIYDECSAYNSGFETEIFPVQASCLCYTAGDDDNIPTWAPDLYYGLMNSCCHYAQTQTQVHVTSLGSRYDLCRSASDVIATPALASPRSTIAAATHTTTPTSKKVTASSTSALPATAPSTLALPATTSSTSVHQNIDLALLIAFIGFWLCEMLV